MGGYRPSRSAFPEADAYSPNDPTHKMPYEILVRRFAELALKRDHVPTEPDLNLKRKEDPTFPGKLVFRRWGSRDALLTAVTEYCEGKAEFAPVLELLSQGNSTRLEHRLGSLRVSGLVYLLRSGKHYKLGR